MHKCIDNGRAKMPRNLTRLIEPALIFAAPVQWHRDDAIDVLEYVASAFAHALGQRPGERMPARVLQGMNDLSERTLIFADCPRSRHGGACGAMRMCVEARQGIAASIAQRRHDVSKGGPARVAYASMEGFVEKLGADSAAWRNDRCYQCVRDVSHR